MVKKMCSFLQQFTEGGGNVWRYLALFYDVILPLDHVTSFLRVMNVKNTCKRLRYSHSSGWISSLHWWKVSSIGFKPG